LIGSASISLSHPVLLWRTVQEVVLSLTDYNSSISVSISALNGNGTTQELVLYETSEGSGVFESSILVCCSIDACPGLSISSGFSATFQYQSTTYSAALNCSGVSSLVSAANCSNSSTPLPIVSGLKQLLRVYNLFLDAPFSISLQVSSVAQSLRFIGARVDCNNSVAVVPLYRSSVFGFDGTFSSISLICPNATLGALIKFTVLVAGEYVDTTAAVEDAPLTSILVDSTQSIFLGAQVHVTVRRNPRQCQSCSEQFMLNIRSSLSAIAVPSPSTHQDHAFIMSFIICGPDGPLDSSTLECINTADGDTLSLEAPGANTLHLRVQSSPALVVSVSHVIIGSCFYVYLSNFSPSMSFQLGSSVLSPQQNSHGMFYVRGCLSNERILYINERFGLNATLLSTVTFSLFLGGFQVSSANLFILSSALNVEIMHSSVISFLARGSSLTVMVAVRNLYLFGSNLTVFASSGQTLSIPFLVNSSSLTLIPVMLHTGCLRNRTEICVFDGISVIASVCASSCFSSGPIQIFFVPEINVPIEHPAGTMMQIDVLDSSITSDSVFVNILLGSSQNVHSTHRLIKSNSSSGHFVGKIPIMEVERLGQLSSRQVDIVKAPYTLRIDYLNYTKDISIVKQSAAMLSCFEDNILVPSHQHFRIVLSHSGAVAPEYVEVKVSGSSTQSQDIRLFRTPNSDVFIGYLDISSLIIAMLGSLLKVSYEYEFEFRTHLASCNISVLSSGSLIVSPPAILMSHAFEITAFNNYVDINASIALIESCFVGSALPCMNLQLTSTSPGHFFAMFNSSEVFPFIMFGSNIFSPLTVCFTFGQFRSCILIADNLEVEHPHLISTEDSVLFVCRTFVPVSDNMPKQLACNFFTSLETSRSIFNINLVWNASSQSFISNFVVRNQCGTSCNSVRGVSVICRYGSIASSFSMTIRTPLLVRIEVPQYFVPESSVLVTVHDADANRDPSLIETAVVSLDSDDMSVPASCEFVETGPSTGAFRSNISVGSSIRLIVSYRSQNGQSARAISVSSPEIRADLTVLHCNRDFLCNSPQPFQLPLITQFSVCALSFLNLALRVSCSSSSQLLIPIPNDMSGSCWFAHVFAFPWYSTDVPHSLGRNQFVCFTNESSLVESSVVQRSYPLIPISPLFAYVIPQAPVLFASPLFLSSISDVSIFLRNVHDSAPQVLKVISSDGYIANITMKQSNSGDFTAIFNPASALSSLTNAVLRFVWRDSHRNSDLECQVAACSPAVLISPSSIGFQGVAIISIFKRQAAFKLFLQVNNTATQQSVILSVTERNSNESGTLYEATLRISSSKNYFGIDSQPLLYALVGSVLIVSLEDSCPFSLLQSSLRVTASTVGTLQAPSTVLAGSTIQISIDDLDLQSSNPLDPMLVNILASSSVDFKRYQFPVLQQSQKFTFKIPTTPNVSLIKQSSLFVNTSDTVTLVYEDAAPYQQSSIVLSVLPSCAANFSVGPLPIEFNRNISIRVMDCDVTLSSVSVRIATVKGVCNVDLGASLNAPGMFAASIVLKNDATKGDCASLLAIVGDPVTFLYVDDAPQSSIQQTHILHNESIAGLVVDKRFVLLDQVAQISLTMCVNSDRVDPVLVRNIRALPSPKFSPSVVADGTEIQLTRVSDCIFVGSIHPVLQPIVPDFFDHGWMKLYSSPCQNCIFASEGDELRVWWPGSDHIETSFAIAQRAIMLSPLLAAAGSMFEIQVFDRDADSNASAIDSISVNVTFLETTVSFVLLENARSSGVFLGIIRLSNFVAFSSTTTSFLTTPSTCVILQYRDYTPHAIIENRVNITSNSLATLEISPQTSFPGSSVVIQVADVTRNQLPFVRENVNVTVQGQSIAPRTVQLFETFENSGIFSAQFILSNGSVMYNVSNPFGVPAFVGQKYSIQYINSAPYAVLSKNIVVAGPGQILVNPIDLEQIVKVMLIDPDNSDFYTDASSVRKIQNLVATSASGNFLAFTVQEQNPGSGIFYGTFNVSSSLIFKPGVLIGVSLASRVLITYLDALPSITITSSIKVASIGSITLVSSSSGSAVSDSEFVFKVVDFDMNSDPLQLEVINVSISSAPNSNFTVKCIESSVDSSEFVCRVFLATQISAPTSLDPSVFVLQASRGQVFVISYLDYIPTPSAFRTATFTVALAGVLTSNTSIIVVGSSFVVSLENFNSNTNPSAKDSAFLTVEHWFAGYLQSSIDFALPETLVSSAVFMGIVATSSLVAPASSTSAAAVVPSVKPGSVLKVFFRQPVFNLFLNITVVVSSIPVLIVPAILLNTDSNVVVSISDIDLNATNVLIPSLDVTVSQTSASQKSTINVTLFASSSNSAFFTGSFRLCSIQNLCLSDLFAPEGSLVNFSYVDIYTGFKIFVSRSVSTRGRMVVPASVLSQNALTIRVLDIDMDVSNALDTLVVVACVVGYTQTVSITLTETDSKSGIFQGVVLVKGVGVASVANAINVPPRGTIQLAYEDQAPPVVVLSSVVVSVPNQIILESPIVIGSFFFINVSDSSAVDPYSILELSFWGGGTRVVLSLVAAGFYSGRAMIADKCSNTSLFSGCIAIMYGADVQAVYRGSSQLSVTIPKSAMSLMIPLIQVCIAGQCTSSWQQAPNIFMRNGGIATVIVTDYDFATLTSLSQFVSVSCGNVSDLIYLDIIRGSLPATQFSASLTVFTDFGDYLASSTSAKLACLPGSVLVFQVRDCHLPDLIVLSARVVDEPRLYTIPSFVIGDYLYMQLKDAFASTLDAVITCTSVRDTETVVVRREAIGETFVGSIYISATLSRSNDSRLSVVRIGERIYCKYVSNATNLVAVISSIAISCSQMFRFGYFPSNPSRVLVVEALLCDPIDEVFASIQCSSGDREDILLSVDSVNPGRYFGTVGYATNSALIAQHDMFVSLDSSALIPCVSTIRLSSRNTTVSSSLHRRVEPLLSAVFDSSNSIRSCIWDADAVSFVQMGHVISFSLRHQSGNCTSQLWASETAPFSGLFCRSSINIFDVLNASQCKFSTMSDYIMVYKETQLRIPIRTAISFVGTSSSAVVGSRISVVASGSTVNHSTSSIDSLSIMVRYSSGIQGRLLLNETDISSSIFSGSLYIPLVCSRLVLNRIGSSNCHDMQATYVEIFLDHLQSPFLITLFSPPVFFFSPLYPVINEDVVVSVVVPNISRSVVEAVVTSTLQPFPLRLLCSSDSSLCKGTIAGALFRSSPLVISVLLSFGVFNASVVGNVAPTIKSVVTSSGVHAITVHDCNNVANSSILTATCNSTVHSVVLARNGCFLTAFVNVTMNTLTSLCSSVVLEYKNSVVFTRAILGLYNPTLGLLNVTASVAAGSSFSVVVTDSDANLNPMKIDVISVTVCSSRTAEPCEDIELTESMNSSGIFTGTIVTVQDASVSVPADGVLNVLPNNVIMIHYFDNSSSRIVTKSVYIVAPCSWSVDSIPQKIVAGDIFSISINDVDLNPLVRDNGPNQVGMRTAGVWSYCNLLEDSISSGVYVGQCQAGAWPVGSIASIYYNCSRSNLQLVTSIFVVSTPRVVLNPNPVVVGDSISVTVFDSMTSLSFVAVSLVRGATNSSISLLLPRANSSAFSAVFPTILTNDIVSCSFPLAFLLSTQFINVSYSAVNRPSSFSVVQLMPKTYLQAKAIFPNLLLKVLNSDAFPYNVGFDAPSANISCSVSFSSSGWISLRLIYSDSVQNLTCNTTAIIIPTYAQLGVRQLFVRYLNAVNGVLLQQQISIPTIPTFDLSNISSLSRSLLISVSGLSNDVGSNLSLRAQSFSSTGSIVDTEFTLLQNSQSGSFVGMFQLSSIASDGFLVLVPHGYVEFLVNGFLSSKYYLYRSCSISIFADFVNSSRREVFVDVRTCSNESFVASVSVLPAQTEIYLNMSQIPNSSLQVLRRGSLPVSFSTQSTGVLYLTSSSIIQVTVVTSGGDTISKSFSLPAWGNVSCFSISKSSLVANAVALGRPLFAASTPNSDFTDPILVQFSFGSDFEVISAALQSNGDWIASLLVEYSAYSADADEKFSNVTVGSTIIASFGNSSCSAVVYMQPSLTVSSSYNGSSWILEIQYVASSQISSLTVFAQADVTTGAPFVIPLQNTAPYRFFGLFNIGLLSCYNVSVWLMDGYEGKLSSTHQLPCEPRLSLWPSFNRSASFVVQGELLDIEVDLTSTNQDAVTVMVQHDVHEPAALQLRAVAGSSLYRGTVAATADGIVSVHLSMASFRLSSSIQVVAKSTIRLYPPAIRSSSSGLFVFLTDSLQSSQRNITVDLAINGCLFSTDTVLNCGKENGVFVGYIALSPSDFCIGFRAAASYKQRGASSNVSAVVFASLRTEILMVTVRPSAAVL
jgi:hypothetical protein